MRERSVSDLNKACENKTSKGLRLLTKACALFAVAAGVLLPQSEANAQTRTLELYNTHTKERASITFRRNGRYDSKGLAKLNHFLRDWRRNESIKMDPKLFDLLWEVRNEAGTSKPIHVVSGYRSPVTNASLRSRSRGVARNSQHTKGRATDFFIPGISSSTLRKIALKKQVGGVGFYPTANTPFVHLDTASVRAWPRMTRKQLVALFPDGKTLHVPSDGKPLKGYAQAAKLEKAGKLERLNSRAGDRRRSRSAETRTASVGNTQNAGNRGILGTIFRGNSANDSQETTPRRQSAPAAAERASARTAPARTAPARPPAPAPIPQARPAVTQTLPAPSAPALETPPAAVPETPPAPEVAPVAEQLIAEAPLPTSRPNALIAQANPTASEQTLAEAAAEEAETEIAETDLVITLPTRRPDIGGRPGTGEIIVANLPDATGGSGNQSASETISAAYARAGISPSSNILENPLAGVIRDGLPLSQLGAPEDTRPRQARRTNNRAKPKRTFPQKMLGQLNRAKPDVMTPTFIAKTGDTSHFVHPRSNQDGLLSAPVATMVLSFFGNQVPTPRVGAFEGDAIVPLAVKRFPEQPRQQATLLQRLFSTQ